MHETNKTKNPEFFFEFLLLVTNQSEETSGVGFGDHFLLHVHVYFFSFYFSTHQKPASLMIIFSVIGETDRLLSVNALKPRTRRCIFESRM